MRSLISHILKVQGNTSDQISNATNEPVINNIAIDLVVSSPLVKCLICFLYFYLLFIDY